VGVVSLAREMDFREEFCFAACQTATLLTLGGDRVGEVPGVALAGYAVPLVIASPTRQAVSVVTWTGQAQWQAFKRNNSTSVVRLENALKNTSRSALRAATRVRAHVGVWRRK
jgi:hypothetical protein